MKRFLSWLMDLLPYKDDAFVAYTSNQQRWSSGRLSISASQAVYRKRLWFKRLYWYGTVEVSVQVTGLRVILPFKKNSNHKGKVLYTYEKHLLRRDSDFVFLLRDLSFVGEHCDVTEAEDNVIFEAQEFILAALPAEHQFDISKYDPKDTDNGMP